MSATKTIADLREALASRDGELAALRKHNKDLAKEAERMAGLWLVEKARAEAAEARARELELDVKEERAGWTDCRNLLADAGARVAALEAALAESVSELMNIANADPSKWDPDERATFRAWAQNRARFTLNNLEEARTRLDAARAGGQG